MLLSSFVSWFALKKEAMLQQIVLLLLSLSLVILFLITGSHLTAKASCKGAHLFQVSCIYIFHIFIPSIFFKCFELFLGVYSAELQQNNDAVTSSTLHHYRVLLLLIIISV